jgi:hypothetical protein
MKSREFFAILLFLIFNTQFYVANVNIIQCPQCS